MPVLLEEKGSENKVGVLWELVAKASLARQIILRIQGHGNEHGEPEACKRATG